MIEKLKAKRALSAYPDKEKFKSSSLAPPKPKEFGKTINVKPEKQPEPINLTKVNANEEVHSKTNSPRFQKPPVVKKEKEKEVAKVEFKTEMIEVVEEQPSPEKSEIEPMTLKVPKEDKVEVQEDSVVLEAPYTKIEK